MIELNNLSIVITTLGNSILTQTINSFYNDLDLKCNFEIIITIPESEPLQCDLSKYKNLIVHKTKFKGQVFQRTEGFKIAKFNYVLQLDDDVEILAISIQNLISEIDKHNQDFCISPIFYDIHNKKKCIYNLSNNKSSLFLKNTLTSLICKSNWGLKRSGRVTDLGTNYGVDIKSFSENTFSSDWLPGGCILHLNKNLIKHDYFPFKGKAYCEDLIHSFLLKKNNINFLVTRSAKCFTDIPQFPSNVYEKLNFIRAYNFFYFKFFKLKLRFIIWQSVNYLRIIL